MKRFRRQESSASSKLTIKLNLRRDLILDPLDLKREMLSRKRLPSHSLVKVSPPLLTPVKRNQRLLLLKIKILYLALKEWQKASDRPM